MGKILLITVSIVLGIITFGLLLVLLHLFNKYPSETIAWILIIGCLSLFSWFFYDKLNG